MLNTTVFLGHTMKYGINVLLLHLTMPNAKAHFQGLHFSGFTMDFHTKIVNIHAKLSSRAAS